LSLWGSYIFDLCKRSITKVEVLRGRIDYLLKAETGVELLKAQELLFRTEELLRPLLIVAVSQAA